MELLRALRQLDRSQLVAARSALEKAKRGETDAQETIAALKSSNEALASALERQRSNWQFIVSTLLTLVLFLLSSRGQVSEKELDEKLEQVVDQILEGVTELGATPEQGQDSDGEKGHKVGRNAPCPCDSGVKFKFCCGSPTGSSNSP